MFILIWRRFIVWVVIGVAIVLCWGHSGGAVPSWAEYYQQAQAHWQQGQTRQAITLWQQILAATSDPDLRSRILLNLTQAYLELGDAVRARSVFAEGKSGASRDLAPLVAGIEGNLALAAGDWDRAIAAYENEAADSLIVLNNLSIAYERRSQQRQQQSRSAQWEVDKVGARKWARLAAEDREEAQTTARKAIELAESEKSLAAARSWLRWGKLGHARGWDMAVEILVALPDSRTKSLLLLEAARHNSQMFPFAQGAAERLAEPSLLAKVWQAEGEYWQERGEAQRALDFFQKAYQSYPARERQRLWSLFWDLGQSYRQLALSRARLFNTTAWLWMRWKSNGRI